MNFEDVAVGDTLPTRTIHEVRPEDTKLLAAVLGDPYSPHFDEKQADELDYPGLLNQGPANLSFMFQSILNVLVSPTDLRGFDVRFQEMVFTGETVEVVSTVEATRVEDGDGLVDFDVSLTKPDGTKAVTGTMTARLPRDGDDLDS